MNKVISYKLQSSLIKTMILFSFGPIVFLNKSLTFLDLPSSPFHSAYSHIFILFIFILFLPFIRNYFLANKKVLVFFSFPIIMLLLETIAYIGGRKFGRTFLEYNFWFAISYYSIAFFLSVNPLPNDYKKRILTKYFLIFSFFYCGFFIVWSLFLSKISFFSYHSLIGYNTLAIMSVCALIIFLFFDGNKYFSQLFNLSFLLTMIATPILIQSITGIFLLLGTIIIFLISKIHRKIIFIPILIVLFIAQFNKDQFEKNLEEYYELYNLTIEGIQIIRYNQDVDIYSNNWLSPNISNQVIGTIIRLRTNQLAIEAFKDNIFFGAGGNEIKNKSKILNYYSHSWVLILMGSYGMVGLFIAITFIFLLMKNNKILSIKTIVLGLFLFTNFFFTNEIYYWLSVIPLILEQS
jgi:hypothetical protein